MSSPEPSIVPGAVLGTIGSVLVVIGLIWGSVIGYYPSDVPVLLCLFAVGIVLAWIGQRLFQSAKRARALETIRKRDEEAGTV